MNRLFPLFCIAAPLAYAAWVTENIPTGIQNNGKIPYLIGKEIASAYRAVYDSNGAKTGEDIAIAYRSKYLYVALRKNLGWTSIRFDDHGRYPSVALDSSGKPHISYFRTSNNKLYYAHTVAVGTGNCGPNASWACEEAPSTIYGAAIGRSAIAIHGTKVHLLIESASGNATYSSTITRVTKTIDAANWDGIADQVSLAKDLDGLAIKVDNSGTPEVLLNSEYLDWYRKANFNWAGIGPLVGTGAFDHTSGSAPRICYREFTSNRLIYARSSGSDYWTETVLDYDIGSQGSCSIAVPVDNGIQLIGYYSPRIAYYDDVSNSVKYAKPPMVNSQSWSIATVAAAGGTRTIDLHLDRGANPTLIYFDASVLKLQMAKLQ